MSWVGAADTAVEEGDNPDEVAPDPNYEDNEQMLIQAYWHVQCARAQRKLYQTLVNKAVNDAKNKVPHKHRTMEMPAFNENHPGKTYYYSPLSVYNLGMVNHAHD